MMKVNELRANGFKCPACGSPLVKPDRTKPVYQCLKSNCPIVYLIIHLNSGWKHEIVDDGRYKKNKVCKGAINNE